MYVVFLLLQRTGLVQFATESGRSAALQMNKTEFHGESIGVAPSRFSLITVAQAPTTTEVPSGVSADHVLAKSAGTFGEAKESAYQQHKEMNKAAVSPEKIQDDIRSESAPPAKSAPVTK